MRPDSPIGWSGGRCTPRSTTKRLRRSRSRLPGVGRSAVSTIAENPAATARSTRARHAPRSDGAYSWNQRTPSGAAAATSSIGTDETVDSVKIASGRGGAAGGRDLGVRDG